MILRLTPEGGLAIDEPYDFTRFSLAARDGQILADSPAVRFADGYAWISRSALEQSPDLSADPDWRAGLARMLTFAEQRGWTDPHTGSIRAHIEGRPTVHANTAGDA